MLALWRTLIAAIIRSFFKDYFEYQLRPNIQPLDRPCLLLCIPQLARRVFQGLSLKPFI